MKPNTGLPVRAPGSAPYGSAAPWRGEGCGMGEPSNAAAWLRESLRDRLGKRLVDEQGDPVGDGCNHAAGVQEHTGGRRGPVYRSQRRIFDDGADRVAEHFAA